MGQGDDLTTTGDRWDRLLGELASQPIEEGWVTLEEAVDATGVSRSTIRSWYRSGRITAKMVAGVHGPQRVVPLAAVIDQALASHARADSSSRRERSKPKSMNCVNASSVSSAPWG